MHQVNQPTVLVAEHYEDTRFLLRFWLEAEGCRVVEAVNGQEAIDETRGVCPDLILMSLRMPVRDGLDATRCIREHVGERGVPIVAMSTYPTVHERASALAAGCDAFIAAPIDFDSLSDLFRQLLPGAARPAAQGLAGA